MKGLLSFIAVAALTLSFSSTVEAATTKRAYMANAQVQPHHRLWSPKKHTYGKRMRAHWGARCKMTGSC
jgi:hypothetical protein